MAHSSGVINGVPGLCVSGALQGAGKVHREIKVRYWLQGVHSLGRRHIECLCSLFADFVFVNLPTHWSGFVTSKSILFVLFQCVIFQCAPSTETPKSPTHTFLAEVDWGEILSSCFSCKQVPFPRSTWCHVFHVCVLYGGDFTVSDGPQA